MCMCMYVVHACIHLHPLRSAKAGPHLRAQCMFTLRPQLALTYAVTHPLHVSELVLRGIFLVKKAELDYIYHTATPLLFPEA